VEVLPAWIKLIAVSICLVLSFFAILFTRAQFFQKHPNALSYANSAGGGVILAVACSHLIPEVIEGFADMELDYPVGMTLILIGYILILLLEKVLFQHDHAHDRVPVNNQKAQKNTYLIEEEDEDVIEIHKKNSIITPIVLVIAVGLHSIFEGIVLGVQTESSGTVSLMIALICHKPITTLFVGIVMVKEKVPNNWFILLAVITCVAAPMGIGIGILIIESGAPEIVFATLSALAAGTFIYIATTEIIAEEFMRSPSASVRWIKFFFLLFGAAIMLILKIWIQDYHGDAGHDHDHDHENMTLYN